MPIFRFKRQSLGEGFSDFLSKESRSVSSFSERKESPFRRTYAVILSFLVFFALSGRLFYLTVVRGAYFRNLSENNRLREKRIEPQRGVIYDRNGIVSARNIPIHKECQIVNEDQVCHFLSPDKALQYEAKGEKIRTKYVVCSLPEQHAFVKVIKFPKMGINEIKEAIKKYCQENPHIKEEIIKVYQGGGNPYYTDIR